MMIYLCTQIRNISDNHVMLDTKKLNLVLTGIYVWEYSLLSNKLDCDEYTYLNRGSVEKDTKNLKKVSYMKNVSFKEFLPIVNGYVVDLLLKEL